MFFMIRTGNLSLPVPRSDVLYEVLLTAVRKTYFVTSGMFVVSSVEFYIFLSINQCVQDILVS